jgi:hypothetical protein
MERKANLPVIPAMDAIVTIWPWFLASMNGKKAFDVFRENFCEL